MAGLGAAAGNGNSDICLNKTSALPSWGLCVCVCVCAHTLALLGGEDGRSAASWILRVHEFQLQAQGSWGAGR